MNPRNLTIKKAREILDSKQVNAKELFGDFRKEILENNPKLNAYLSVFDFKEPETANRIISGIPCAVKDNILIRGEITTAASKSLENYRASYDATVISKLKSAGAVFLGKTNLDEFAMGTTTENSAFGPTLNPHDHSRVAGGSSGGSAVAVAAGLTVYALGSDTGGSVRAPASLCGVVGFKPTYGRVSRSGLIAMASGFDQIGSITRNVRDSAIVMNHISGHDPLDATSSKLQVPDFEKDLEKPIKRMKIAVPKEFFGQGLDREVDSKIQRAISRLESLGVHIDSVSLPLTDYALAVYYILVPSEVSANMARYDGIRYGYSTHHKSENLADVYFNSRAESLGEEVKRRIMLGTYTLSAGYYEAYYLKAQKVRTLIKQSFEKIFEKYDAIVGPTMPFVAPKLGELDNPLATYLADIYTVQVNIAGLPAISVPCGNIEKDGKQLPVGFQIIGNYFNESKILQIAHNLESDQAE